MDSIDQARKLMLARLAELEEERKAIRGALDSLEQSTDRSADGARPKHRRQRTTSKRTGRGKRARRGERQVQFLKVVRKHPGEPISAIAREMGVKPQQLYPIARRLADSGAIAKHNGGYAATEKEGQPAS
jgi:hypothetical protein